MLSKREGFSKAFNRVKQKVDQNLGRAEATRPLNDESVEAERRISNVQKAMDRFNKVTKDYSDQCAKPPEELLVKSFQKNGEVLGQHRDLGDIWLSAAGVEKQLATERENLQAIMKATIDDRCRHVEELLANVRRMRKDLDNYILDMDAARRRYTQLMRQQGNNGSVIESKGQQSFADNSWSSTSTSPAPPQDFSADLAAAWQKVECARDSLAAEMNEIIAHEYEYGEVVVQFMEQQAAYHERSVRILNNAIPSLRERLSGSVYRPVFGLSLSDHLRLWRRRVSIVIEYCCLHLLKFGKTEEGLFRIAAGASKIRRLKAKFNSGQLNAYQWPPAMPLHDYSATLSDSSGGGQNSMLSDFIMPPVDPNESHEFDVHALAGVLKQYLRELPDPLLTSALCEEWTQAALLPEDDRVVVVQALLSKLPPENYENLRYLVHFLSLLTHYADQNRMTPTNVGIVIGPNIMSATPRMADNSAPIGANMQHPAKILQTFIDHVDVLFPGRTAFKPETNAYIYDCKVSPDRPEAEGYLDVSPPGIREIRRWSNGGSVIEDELSLGSEATVPNEEPPAALPSSGAFLTGRPSGNVVKNDNVAYHPKPAKKVPGQNSHALLSESPRLVKSFIKSISRRHDDSRKGEDRIEETDLKRDTHRNLLEASRPSTILNGSKSRLMLPDMEITTGSTFLTSFSTSRTVIEENGTEDVDVLDTSAMRRVRGSQKYADLADAAVQRVLRAEVRRLKSKEMRNRFFSGEAVSPDVPRDVSITVPSIPGNVLIFPPSDMTELSINTSRKTAYRHAHQVPLIASSLPAVAVAGHHKNITATTSMMSMKSGSSVLSSCDENIEKVRRSSAELLHYIEGGGDDEPAAATADLPPPEHLGHGSPDQAVPRTLQSHFHQEPALEARQSADGTSRSSSGASTISSTAASAVQPSSFSAHNKGPPVDYSHKPSYAGDSRAPVLPRRRAPIAPPHVPPPPPPPTTPPPNLAGQVPQSQRQPYASSGLPPPLVPSPARPLRSATSKTVVVSQTTPSQEFDPIPTANKQLHDGDESLDSNGLLVTSL